MILEINLVGENAPDDVSLVDIDITKPEYSDYDIFDFIRLFADIKTVALELEDNLIETHNLYNSYTDSMRNDIDSIYMDICKDDKVYPFYKSVIIRFILVRYYAITNSINKKTLLKIIARIDNDRLLTFILSQAYKYNKNIEDKVDEYKNYYNKYLIAKRRELHEGYSCIS